MLLLEWTNESNNSFNDTPFYQSLWNETGCRSVEISSVCIYHTGLYGIYEMQSFYRIIFADGAKVIRAGPEHIGTGDTKTVEVNRLVLKENEFIQGIHVAQVKCNLLIYGIAFVTNQREVNFGCHGTKKMVYLVNMIPEEPELTKVVTFSGEKDRSLYLIGFTTEAFAWKAIGTHICLRELVAQGRAAAKPSIEEDVTVAASPGRCNQHNSVMQRWIALDDADIFRYILKFLIPTRGSQTTSAV